MWSPTHIVVTVLKAKGLYIKGKNGTNNCFVTIALGKEKYQTTIKDKVLNDVDWHEECELSIPSRGNKAELILTVLHRNKLGLDEFLGQLILPLCDLDVYETPKSKWFKLHGKLGKENKKNRGELEVRLSFTVKAGSLVDLSKIDKNKSTPSLGGSLLSLSTLDKRKKIKDFAKSFGNKNMFKRKSKSSAETISLGGSSRSSSSLNKYNDESYSESLNDAGVISENDDEFIFDNLSQKGSTTSLAFSKDNSLSKRVPVNVVSDDSIKKLSGNKYNVNEQIECKTSTVDIHLKEKVEVELKNKKLSTNNYKTSEMYNTIELNEGKKNSPLSITLSRIGYNSNIKKEINEDNFNSHEKLANIKKQNFLSENISKKFESYSREELVMQVFSLEKEVSCHKQKIRELEDYLDLLLLRVMEKEPRLLQNPYGRATPNKSG